MARTPIVNSGSHGGEGKSATETTGSESAGLSQSAVRGASRKSRSRVEAAVYQQEQIDSVATFLQKLPPKEPEKTGLNRMEAISILRKDIEALKAKGYRNQDIAEILGTKGITISASTLQNYLQAARAKDSKTAPKRPRKSPKE